MAFRARGRGSVTVPNRTQILPGTPVDEDGGVKCTGHGRRCKRLVAGPLSKNPGKAFYACPLNRDDPNKCKFFQWEDELPAKTPQKGDGQASNGRALGGPAQTLGQSPHARFGKPNATASPSARPPPTPPRVDSGSDEIEELDWDKVDTEEMERDAIASTPKSSQKSDLSNTLPDAVGGTSFQDRLKAVAGDAEKKRKREDSETPKKAMPDPQNPFVATPGTPRSPSHPVISPALASLGQISEHIQRQDRLLHAAEQMKQGLRKTVTALQLENKALSERVKELEARVG